MSRALRRAAAVLAAALLVSGGAGAELVAERIDDANVGRRLIGGPDAIGGIGDWYLANDVVEVIVDDPSRKHAKLGHGGTIVDAGLRDRRAEDQFARLFPLVNLDQRVQLNYDSMRAELDPDGRFARLVVWSERGLSAIPRGGALERALHPLVPDSDEIASVFAETTYEVRPGEPFVRITTRLANRGDRSAPVFAYADVWMRGGRSMRSFVANTLEPARSRGFRHLSFDRNTILAAGDAMAAYTVAAMAGLPPFPPISYALVSPERAARELPFFGVTGPHVTLVSAFIGDPVWDEMSLWRLFSAIRDELAPGVVWSHERRLVISGGDDVASGTDLVFPMLGVADGSSGIRGRIEPPDARVAVHVRDADGNPVTQILASAREGEPGSYRAVLPPGAYTLALHPEHRPVRELAVQVEPGAFSEVPLQRLEALGALRFGPAFADGGAGRVVVSGLEGTPDPVFGAELLDFRLDGKPADSGTETRELLFAGVPGDPERVELPAGRYRLTATRGPQFEIVERELELGAEEVRVEPFELARVAALPGFTSADFHVHSQASDDSGMSNAQRLKSFVAEYVEVMVSTDHDHLGRFGPTLSALRLADAIVVLQGVEVTSSAPSPAAPFTIGHHNAWPVPYRPYAHRRGAPPSQDLSVADLYSTLRGDYGAQVVQLNHALGKQPGLEDGAFFSHFGTAGEAYEPALPIHAEPNRLLLERSSDGSTRAIDFDAMEVMNGDSFDQYLRLRSVWYSLLRQGFRRTATGNSDTHGPDEVAGYPRNYVATGPAGFEPAAFDQAIREGRLFATTGPLITDFRANGGRMGDLVAAPEGSIELQVAVSAPAWIPVDEVRVLVNGEAVRTWRDVAAPEKVMRLLRRETLELEEDGFVTIEAGAALDVDVARWRAERGGAYAARVAPGFVAQALANPIFVDVDGNGRFDAPGVDSSGARSGSARLVVSVVLLLALAALWWRLRRRASSQRDAM